AFPMIEACINALAEESERYGENAVRKRYHIPARFNMPQHPQPLIASLGISSKKTWPAIQGEHPVGKAKVPGYLCQIYKVENPERSLHLWIEPETGLVLRLEDRQIFPGRQPPLRHTYVISRLAFKRNIPQTQFELPAGITAQVPTIFANVRLPKGVKRVAIKG